MTKQKTSFACSSCNFVTPKWAGCCPHCNEWNTIVETEKTSSTKKHQRAASLTLLNAIQDAEQQRIYTGIAEWDRVMGGGIVPGSFMILSGDPGIGKSTLLLQIAHALASRHRVLYFCSEESLTQVKGRVQRIIQEETSILFSDEAHLATIFATLEQERPTIAIIDSIQNCYDDTSDALPGSITQLKEAGFELMRIAKEKNIAIIVTGHITKEGTIAGPKTLEHMVDAVFYLQAEDQWNTRILRSMKNRFGPLYELGFFSMQQEGLTELTDINKRLLDEVSHSPGSVLVSHLEGSRPLLLELQALVVPSRFGVPQRVITGVDHKRVVLVCAILEKYLQVKLSEHDVFFKVSGGAKLNDHSSDLGIALALLSSYFQIPLKEKSLALGELTLPGHIKPVNHLQLHLQEAERFGITTLFLAEKQALAKASTSIVNLASVYQLLQLFI